MAAKTVRVPIHRTTPTQTVSVEVGATKGAQIGLNLLLDDGTLATTAKLRALFGITGSSTGTGPDTTDALDEGSFHFYFTNLRAQDAVGGILVDTATIDFAYVGGTSITATLKDLADSGTGAALVKLTRDSKGRISGTSAATTDDLTEGATNLWYTDARADARITAQKGVANGLAPLESDGKISVSYLPAAVLGQVSYQGTWDASAGTPPTATPDKGWYYIVAVAGSMSLSGITDWKVGDWAIYNGASWDKVDNTDAVVTVNGYTGAVTLTYTDVGAASAAQGAKADTAVQSVVAGTNVSVDNTDPLNPVISATGGGGTGDVVGPAASTDSNVALFDGMTGKLLKDGGMFGSLVRSAVLTGLSLATSAVIAATDTVLQAFGKLQAQITDNLLPKGYIDGLQMQWVSGTALTVTSGAAYIEGSSKVLRATSAIAKTGLSLTASTWYHVYLYDNAGTTDVEIVTTAPVSPYSGTARSKTGDTSRRYVGSVRTDSSGNIYAFKHHSGGLIAYMANIISAPFVVVNAGVSTTPASFSVAALVPITSTAALLQARNTDSSVAVVFGTSDQGYTLTASAFQSLLDAGSAFVAPVNTDSSQSVQYMFRSAPTGVCNVRCVGYLFDR